MFSFIRSSLEYGKLLCHIRSTPLNVSITHVRRLRNGSYVKDDPAETSTRHQPINVSEGQGHH